MEWLSDSDPSIRWQVMRDLTDEPADAVAGERSRVAAEGWGARLLNLQAADGRWGDGTYHPYWTSTHYTLMLLRNLGLDPDSAPARRAIELVADKVRWEGVLPDDEAWHGNRFFSGEVDTCINGMVLALGGYFGRPSETLMERLIAEQLDDGGWNCWAGDAFPEETAGGSSLNTTICVLEGLLEYERATGAAAPEVTRARERGQEMLLERRLLRPLPTDEEIDQGWRRPSVPDTFLYDVLRGLDYLRAAGVEPDDRMGEAVDLIETQRLVDGSWLLHEPHPGEYHFEMEKVGEPSRWVTLRALRVLAWVKRRTPG